MVKVKVSHSLIAVGAVGVRVPLYLGPQDIDVASIEPIQSFLSLYIYYYIIEEKG